MRHGSFNRWIFFILIVSAFFRFGYLIFGDVLPVMWDARRYAAAAIGILSYVDGNDFYPPQNARDDRYQFKYYNDKYIQGEQIDWLAYKPHTLTQARNELFFSGPLYPFFLSVIFYLTPTADFTFARIFGIILDLLSNLLIMLIAIRLAGRAVALIVGFIYAVYFPFILASTMLMLETSTSFLILLAIYLMLRAFENNNKKFYVLAGIITGLLILNKPTAMLLGIPFVISFYFYTKGKLPLNVLINRLLVYSIPVIVIFLSWLTVASLKYGQLTLREPTYKEANLRQSSSIMFEGYDLDKVEKDFWSYSIEKEILHNPFGYMGLLAKKFERLWSRPFNDFKKSFIVPYKVDEIIHKIIVSFGLFGLLILLIRNFGKASWIFFIAGYYSSIHVIFHSVSRYSFNALPLVMIASGYFIYESAAYYLEHRKSKRKLLVLALLILLLVWAFNYSWINTVFHTGLSKIIVSSVLIIKYILSAIALWILSCLFLPNKNFLKKLLLPVVATLVFIVVGWSTVLSRNEWSEFVCRLNSSSMKAGTRIYISKFRPTKKGELLAAVIDINSGQGRKNTFTVSIGNLYEEFVGGKPPLSKLFYPKPTYKFYARLEPMGIEEFRQYAIIPVEDSMVQKDLKEKGYIDISVAINNRIEEKNNFVNIYGNYPVDDTIHYIPGVRFTSIERYVHKNDPRIRYPVKFSSDSTISYYIKRNSNNIVEGADLSPSPGYQTGRYNIFLIQFMPDGSFVVY
ncbi:MAG: glycosyltransferase family 39 protein [FCB group bacterium]|nr:glycosyltransferase family 39 protein [FCB group bacterium]